MAYPDVLFFSWCELLSTKMVLVTPEEFIPKLKALFSQEIKGVKGAVTVQEKSSMSMSTLVR